MWAGPRDGRMGFDYPGLRLRVRRNIGLPLIVKWEMFLNHVLHEDGIKGIMDLKWNDLQG